MQAPATKLLNEIDTINTTSGAAQNLCHITPEAFEEAINYATTDTKVKHIFEKPMHKLDELTRQLGGPENVIRAVLNNLSGKMPFNGVFKNIQVTVEGFDIYLHGRMMDGVPKIGTMFIK